MRDFELKLGATNYMCTSNAYEKDHQNWSIRAKFNDLTLDMSIPISSKVSMEKVLIFITSLDEALRKVQQEKKEGLSFINQLT